MIALTALLAAITVSILVGRVATQAFEITGLSREAASFQARSALTGTGFTTREAESVVDHPVRRRILMLLMVLQSAGLVTIVSTFVLSFVDTGDAKELLRRVGVLLAGLGVLWLLARSQWVERGLSRVIDWSLRRFTTLDVTDFFTLLSLQEDYAISSLRVSENTWLADRTLAELDLPDEGVLILGIRRDDGSYVGAPRGRYTIREGDTLVLYGLEDRLSGIGKRMRGETGEQARYAARAEHEEELSKQDREELAYQSRKKAESE